MNSYYKIVRKLLYIALSSIVFYSVMAVVEISALTGPVEDHAEIINSQIERQIDQISLVLKDATETQLQVLTIASLEEEDIESFAIHVFDKWKLGNNTSRRGVLLLVAVQERRMRIEVGQGLEGDLPDAYAKRIIDNFIVPAFRESRFSEGILAGVIEIIKYTDPNFEAAKLIDYKYHRISRSNGPSTLSLPFILFILFLVVFILPRRRGFSSFGGSGWGHGGRGGGRSSWGGGGGFSSGGGASGSW